MKQGRMFLFIGFIMIAVQGTVQHLIYGDAIRRSPSLKTKKMLLACPIEAYYIHYFFWEVT